MIFTYILYSFILITSVVFFYLADLFKSDIERKIVKTIAFTFIFLPFAFRYNVGTDYYNYNTIYDASLTGGVGHGEFGYLLINKLFSVIGFDFSVFVIFWSFLVLCFLFFGNRKGWWVFVLFFMCQSYLYFMSNFRTSFVYSIYVILFFSFYENRDEKNVMSKYFLVIAFLSIFHKTALLLAVIPFLSKLFTIFIKNKFILFSFLAILLIGFDFLYPLIVSVATILGYGDYFEMNFFMSGAQMGTGLGVVAKLLPIVFVLWFFEKIVSENKNNVFVLVSLIVYFVFMVLAIKISILNRVAVLFSFSYPMAMWIFWNCQKIKNRKILVLIFAFLNIVIFLKDISSNRSDQCIGLRISPYVSIFNKDDDISNKEFSSNCALQEI